MKKPSQVRKLKRQTVGQIEDDYGNPQFYSKKGKMPPGSTEDHMHTKRRLGIGDSLKTFLRGEGGNR